MRRRHSHDDAHDGGATPASLAKLAEPGEPPRRRIGQRLRNYFLTGLIIVGPLTITIYIVWWAIDVIDAWVKPILPDLVSDLRLIVPDSYVDYLPNVSQYSIPGLGLLAAIVGLTIIGALTANLFGRTLVSYGEIVLGRMPVVRNVYGGLKQIFETVLSQSSSTFQKVGLIEYPRKGLYSIVFVSTVTRGEIQARCRPGEQLVSVFLPTTPNPTSGYLLFVPHDDVLVLEMSVEDAAKMVISAGLVTPAYQAELAELAAEARGKTARSGQAGATKPTERAPPPPAE